MRLKIDRESNALYLRLDEREIIASEQVVPGIILDFDKDGQVVGFEVLEIGKRTTKEHLGFIQFETA